MTQSMEGFLLGGTKTPGLKYDPDAKTEHTLTITEEPELRQQTNFEDGSPEFWPNGDPRMQLVVTGTVDESERIDSDDDLQRREYIKGEKQKAVGAALREAGAKTLEPGGKLWIKCLGREKISGTNKTKNLFKAAYKKPDPAQSAQASFLGNADGPGDAPPFAVGFYRPKAYLTDPGDRVEAV